MTSLGGVGEEGLDVFSFLCQRYRGGYGGVRV